MSSGGSSGGSTTTTSSGPPPQVMQAYEGLVNAASGVASQPLTQYTGEMVAGFSPQQQAGFQTIDNAQGIGFPYINAAAQQYGQATAPLWQGLPQFDTSSLPGYGTSGIQNAQGASQQIPQLAQFFADQAKGRGEAVSRSADSLAGSVNPYTAAAGNYGNAQASVASGLPQYISPYYNFGLQTANDVSGIGAGLQGQAQPYQNFGTDTANSMSGIAGGLQGRAQPYQNYGTGSADNMGGIAGGLQSGVSPYTGFGYGQAGDVADISQQVRGGVSPYQAAASRGIRLPGYNTLDTYLSPYTNNVTSALQDLFNQQNAEQFQQIRGNAATQGAYGGDREAVAEAITARQQQLGEAPALSQALQSGFAQAQNELNTQQNLQLQRQQAERQLSLGAGQLGLGGYQTAGQLAGQAGQLGLSAGQLGLGAGTAAGQLYGQQGQLGLSAGQLGLGAGTAAGQIYGQAGQLGLGAGQLGLGAGTAAGNLGIGAGNLGLGAGNLNLGVGSLQGQLYNNAGQLQLGSGNQALQTGLGQGQLYNQAGQLQLGAGQLGTGGLMQGGQLGLSAGQAGYGEFNTQQAQQLAADQANRWLASQAGFGMSSLGNQALSQALTGANAQIGAGALQQQLAQEQLNIPYQQFLQAQAYPYQQLSFLSPIVEGTGSLSGGKGSTTYPGPSALSQIGGLGAAATGLSGLFGSGSSGGDQTSFGGGDYGGGFDPSSVAKTGGRIGYARGGTTPDVPGVGNGVPILDLSYIPTETDRPVGSSLGIGIGAGGSQTTSGGGGGSGLLGGIGSAVGAVKTAVDVGSALGGVGDFLGGLFLLKDGGRAGFALGGDTADPTQVDPTQSDPTKLNTSRWALPKVPKISLDDIIPLKGNAGPAIKGKGPPELQAMPQQMPGQPQDSGLKGIGDLGKSLKGMNLFGSSDDSSDSADKGYAGGGVPLSAAINSGGGSPGQSMQVEELRRLPLEQLYEMSVRFPPNTQQGQMVARVLNEKKMAPGEGTAPTGAPAQAAAGQAGGMGMGGGYGAASAGGMGGQPQDYGGTSHLAHGGEADDEPGFVTEDELDPHTVVDHSGDSVVIRYPSEGKTLDLGLPSIKDERRHYAGGGAAPWLAGLDPALTSSGTSKIVPGTNVAFDRSYYLEHNPDVKAAGIDPFVHYNEFGWHEGRNPSQQFNTNYYLQQNPDVAASGVNPLEQYMQFGRNEPGRSPSAEFPGASLSSPTGARAVSPNGVGVPMLATNASAPADRIAQSAGSQTLAPGGGLGNWFQAMPQRTQFGTGPGGSTVFPSATAYTPGMSGVISGLTKGKGTIPPEFGGGPGGTPATPSATSPFGDGLDPVVAQFFGIGGGSSGNRRGGRIGYAEGGAPDVDMGSNPNWELQYNNFAGIRRVGAKPGQGGFTAYATPEEGVGAIAGQLDRYAQGKVTGKPINTLGAMVRTWAPPNENQTDLLVNRAAQNTGFHPNQPLDIGDPSVKSKLIDAFIRNEQGNRNPVSMDLINRVSGITPPAAMAPAGSDGGQDGPMRRGGRIGYDEGGDVSDDTGMAAIPDRSVIEKAAASRSIDDLLAKYQSRGREFTADIPAAPSRRQFGEAREPPTQAPRDSVPEPVSFADKQAAGRSMDRLVSKYDAPPKEFAADIPPPDRREFTADVPSPDRREFTADMPPRPKPDAEAAIPVEEEGVFPAKRWHPPGYLPPPPPELSPPSQFAPVKAGDQLDYWRHGIGSAVERATTPYPDPMANLARHTYGLNGTEVVSGIGPPAGPDAPPPLVAEASIPPAAPGIGAPATAESAPGLGQPSKPVQAYRDATRLADITGGDLELPGPFQSLTTAAAPTASAAAAPVPNVTRVTPPAKVAQFPEPPKEAAAPAAGAPSGAIAPLSTDVVIGGKVWRDGKPIGPATPAAAPTPPVTRVTSPPQVTGTGKPYTPATPEGKQAAAETAPTGGSTVEFGGSVPAVVHPGEDYYRSAATQFTGGNPGNWMGVGDSLAVGYIRNAGLGGTAATLKTDRGAADADAAGGRSPQEVLNAIRAHPERYQGKNVLLSGGVSNDPSQVNLVPQQIKALQDAHAAKIRVLGVGNREGDEGGQHYNLAPHNAQIEQYAKGPATAAAPPPASDTPGAGSSTGTPETRGIPQMMRPIADALTNSAEAKQAGLTKANMAGILGHLPVESRGGDPTAIARGDQKDGGDSRGIFQWDPNRWANGVRWAQQNGINDFETNGAAQARFAIYEGLSGQDAGAARALAEMKAAGNDPVKSAIAWNHFERPQGYQSSHPEYGLGSDQRQYHAERIFAALNGGTPYDAGLSPGRARGMPADGGSGGGGPRQPGPGQPDEVIADKNGKPVVTPAGQPVVDAFRKDLTQRTEPKDRNRLKAWMDSPSFILFMVGAGMLASRSPFASVALGEGLLAAGKSAQEVRKDQSREDLAEQRINSMAGRVGDAREKLAETSRHNKENESAATQRIAQAAENARLHNEVAITNQQRQLDASRAASERAGATLEEKRIQNDRQNEINRLKLEQAKPTQVQSQDENGNPVTILIPPGAESDQSKWVKVGAGPKQGAGMTDAQREAFIEKGTATIMASPAGMTKTYAEARAEAEKALPPKGGPPKPPTFDPNQPATPYTGPSP